MSTLEDIKARAGVNQYLGKTASQDEAKDTLKVIAALEAVEVAHAPVDAAMYSGSNARLVQVCTGCGQDDGNWQRYPCPTVRVIKEALQ